MDIDPLTQPLRSPPPPSSLAEIKLPKSFKITAPQINEVSHSRRSMRRRENRLKKRANEKTRKALEVLSEKKQVLGTAQSTKEIDEAHNVHRSLREDLRSFEMSKPRLKDQRNQRLRSTRTWAKLAAAERRYVQEHARRKERDKAGLDPSSAVSPIDGWCETCNGHHVARSPESRTYAHPTECPKAREFILPVLLIGSAGTGVGSRIGGHARRGGGKMREQHIRYCPVGMTNEYRSSKTCVFCFQPVQLARSRRLVNGKVKIVKVHGAVECVNPACDSFKCGYTIKPRDPHASVCIAIAGASNLLSSPRTTLPPFSRVPPRPTTINTSPSALEKISSSHSRYPSIEDTTRAPSGQEG